MKKILSFIIAGVTATINERAKTISITLPHGTVLTALSPTITTTPGTRVNPGSGTAKDFTNPVVYKVKAGNNRGASVDYTVTVTVAANVVRSSDKKITSFNVLGTAGSVNEGAKSITVNVPHGTATAAMIPTIGVSSRATVNPASGRSQNFESPVVYQVTAEDGTTQDYVVTVMVAADPAIAVAAAKKKKRNFILLVTGCILAFIGLIVGAVAWSSSDDEDKPYAGIVKEPMQPVVTDWTPDFNNATTATYIINKDEIRVMSTLEGQADVTFSEDVTIQPKIGEPVHVPKNTRPNMRGANFARFKIIGKTDNTQIMVDVRKVKEELLSSK